MLTCGRRGSSTRSPNSSIHSTFQAPFIRHGYPLSDDFHVAVEFPIGDGLAELPLLPFACCRIVIDEAVAEQIACRLRRLEPACRLHGRARQLPRRGMFDLVGVALDRLAGVDLV